MANPTPVPDGPNPWEAFGAAMGRIESEYKTATDAAKATRKEAIKKAKAERDAALKARPTTTAAQAA